MNNCIYFHEYILFYIKKKNISEPIVHPREIPP